eukprot:sb/3476739/
MIKVESITWTGVSIYDTSRKYQYTLRYYYSRTSCVKIEVSGHYRPRESSVCRAPTRSERTENQMRPRHTGNLHVLPRLILVSSSIVDGSIWTTETMILLQEINHTTVILPSTIR